MTGLEALAEIARDWLWGGFVVFLRIGGLVSLLPGFGEQSVPVRVKLGIAVAFTLIVLPAVSATLPAQPEGLAGFAGIILSEVTTGLFFGLMLRFFVLTLQTAGMIAAQATSLSQLFGASPGGEPSPVISNILVMAALGLAALLGLHLHAARYGIASYGLIPAGRALSPGTVLESGLSEIGRSLGLAVSLAAPFVIASLLYNITLGIINRAMPQLMVTFVGTPAITAGAFLILFLAMPVMLQVWSDGLFGFMERPFGAPP